MPWHQRAARAVTYTLIATVAMLLMSIDQINF